MHFLFYDEEDRLLLDCAFCRLPLQRAALESVLLRLYGREKCCFQRETAAAGLLREKLLAGALSLGLSGKKLPLSLLPAELVSAICLPEGTTFLSVAEG